MSAYITIADIDVPYQITQSAAETTPDTSHSSLLPNGYHIVYRFSPTSPSPHRFFHFFSQVTVIDQYERRSYLTQLQLSTLAVLSGVPVFRRRRASCRLYIRSSD